MIDFALVVLKALALTLALWYGFVAVASAAQGHRVSAANLVVASVSVSLFAALMGWLS
jgi:hypothetical protein